MEEVSNKYNNGIGATAPKAATAATSTRRKVRRSTSNGGGSTTKILVALLAGAGAAFLLASMMLMSRLEADELSNGLLEHGVGGTQGVDDQIYLEEVSQGRAAAMSRQKPRMTKEDVEAAKKKRQKVIVDRIEKMKKGMEKKEKKFEKRFGMSDGADGHNPMAMLTHDLMGKLGQVEQAVQGKGKLPKFDKGDLKKEFHEMLRGHDNTTHLGLTKAERREKHKLRQHKGKGHIVVLSEGAEDDSEHAPHLYPRFPPLPPHTMALDLFGEGVIDDVLSGKPTVAGIIAILQRFLTNLHAMLVVQKHAPGPEPVIDAYFDLVNRLLLPFEDEYRGQSVFPVREDGSIFMSLGAYRDHLLGETLRQAFKTAADPDKLFIGAVVQNCFGLDGQPCRTGVEVKGKDKNGATVTKVSDAPPDKNGIVEFCTDPDYKQYCDAGQVRALYVNETESNGPTTARYFASKLWGGETYFMQSDAHLRFAKEWDRLYKEEVQVARNYPKAVLTSYPPGFDEGDPTYQGGSTGTRLCSCTFSDSDVEHKILRINVGGMCQHEETAPTQVAFIAAGFFFARAEFLVDVPFDPYLPWCFMGEEIALSLRAWTSGWDIYAPRKNWIAHQYRPGRMGLPKFWENTGRVFGRPGPGFNTRLQTETIQRIKHLVGYPSSKKEIIDGLGYGVVLTETEHYGPGTERSMEDFLKHTGIDLETEKCSSISWCNHCQLD